MNVTIDRTFKGARGELVHLYEVRANGNATFEVGKYEVTIQKLVGCVAVSLEVASEIG